jgi:SAM-dependent methyltransferase
VDLDEYRSESLQNWERSASNWDEERDFLWENTGEVSERLIARLDPKPGETVLEIAGGTGDLGLLAAERVGEGGRVIETDFASAMVEAARRRGEERGLANLEHRVLDAERMDLDDDSVDGVLCRFGYMLMADPAAALGETRRVLKDGGRLAFAVWAAPDKNLWAAIPGMVLVGRGHMPPPEPGAPGIFAMADPDRISELVTGAGFGEPQIEQVPVKWSYDTTEKHWEMTIKLAAPIAAVVNGAPDEEREAIRTQVAGLVDEQLAGGADIDGLVHVVSAS